MRCITRIAFLAGCLAWTPAPAELNLSGTHWDHVAQRHGLDPIVLYAVALQESRKTRGTGLLSPWPWVTRSPEGPRFYASRDEATADLRRLVSTYRPVEIDVGIMQVNLRWHGHKVQDPALLLDPKVNIEIAAGILREALHSAPGDLELALGRYNTYTEQAARGYGRQVLAVHPREGLLRPARFLSIAAENGLMQPLTRKDTTVCPTAC